MMCSEARRWCERAARSLRSCCMVAVVMAILGSCGSLALSSQLHSGQAMLPADPPPTDIFMPGVTPIQHDQYFCTMKKMDTEQDVYITKLAAHAKMQDAHHMIVFGCMSPGSNKKVWDCEYLEVCAKIRVKNTLCMGEECTPTVLPSDVGFKIGSTSEVNYLVLQVHYATVREQYVQFVPLPMIEAQYFLLIEISDKDYDSFQQYLAGIFLLAADMRWTISANMPKVHVDIACRLGGPMPIHAFAYRVHAHSLGRVVTGYKVTNGAWSLLGKGNPQWPQSFYPMDEPITINPNDFMAARCTFDSRGRNRITNIGSTANDEMCNFYVMFYTDAKRGVPYGECSSYMPQISDHLPAASDVPLPPNPLLEEATSAEHHDGSREGHLSDLDQNLRQAYNRLQPTLFDDVGENYFEPEYNDDYEYYQGGGGDPRYRDRASLLSRLLPYGDRDYNSDSLWKLDDPSGGPRKSTNWPADDATNTLHAEHPAMNIAAVSKPKSNSSSVPPLKYVSDWPAVDLHLGNIGGVAVDNRQQMHIFHRGDRVWSGMTFDHHQRLRSHLQTPITQNTILTVDSGSGRIESQWGANQFYLPHGVTVDRDNNVWVTDVGAHQVYKFPPGGAAKPLLVLGKRFEPGDDNEHFCQPADIAVHSNGDFYVADGYCNARIMRFNRNGDFISKWNVADDKGISPIVHSITLAEDKGLVCVSLRMEARISCYKMDSTFVKTLLHDEFQPQLNAIEYSPVLGGVLYAINAVPQVTAETPVTQGLTLNITTGEILATWKPTANNFTLPHDLAVSPDGGSVFVSELKIGIVWKFLAESKEHQSVKKATIGNENIVNSKKIKGTAVNLNPQKHSVKLVAKNVGSEEESSEAGGQGDMSASMIIMALLAVPVLLMIIITIIIRLKRQGRLNNIQSWVTGYQPPSDKFNLGNILNRHHGFDRVSTEESDHEIDPLRDSDSDVDEFTVPITKA
ncbi:PREDICTED: peptidyl-glycine alpha-amidating monooxygenase B-like [Priapulus caudatus]|uniref:Peptidyl-glycine alpha-amidating monooxygenase B-like n=1 Tax=Priapulus caudatus TaxID=37621 RepID=A0ABM1E2H0_PRICU|nr:PREDICTED: peptidyl-glycine alpha-amidating monooxygenase B-like [Priapulus caudatus]